MDLHFTVNAFVDHLGITIPLFASCQPGHQACFLKAHTDRSVDKQQQGERQRDQKRGIVLMAYVECVVGMFCVPLTDSDRI